MVRPPSRTRLLVAALALGSVVGPAGCSSGSGTDGSAKAKYAKQADQACQSANAELGPLTGVAQPTESQYRQVQAVAQRVVDQLDNPLPPQSEQQSVYRLEGGFRAVALAAGAAAQTLATGGDPADAATAYAQSTQAPKASISSAAATMNAPTCARVATLTPPPAGP